MSENGCYPNAFYLKYVVKMYKWVHWLKPKSPVVNRIVTSIVTGQSSRNTLQACSGFWRSFSPVAFKTYETSQVCCRYLSKEMYKITNSEECPLWTCHILASFNVPWLIGRCTEQFFCLRFHAIHYLINYCHISVISSSGVRSLSVLMVPQINLFHGFEGACCPSQ